VTVTAPPLLAPAVGGRLSRRLRFFALLRLELRRNPMVWMLPVSVVLFWFLTYRKVTALAPLWDLRATTMQSNGLLDFALPVVGAAAWTGSREGRRQMTDLVTGTARPRVARQLAAWAATAAWAVVGYLVCAGALYAVTARQARWGGPLWWPVAVDIAGVLALSAVGFTAGTYFPNRYTAPVATLGVFLALGFSTQPITGAGSYWDISPIVAGPWDLGPNAGVATFYHYLPDLSMAQVMFLAGLTVAVVATLGLSAGSGDRRVRQTAMALTTAGLLVAGTSVALAGTGRLDAQGMIAIPALHDAASDLPVDYTPVCSHGAVPVCFNPAYVGYLPAVTGALGPVLDQVAGLAGAPVRVSQVAVTYAQGPGNRVGVVPTGPLMSGRPPVFHLVLPDQEPAPSMTAGQLGVQVAATAGPRIVESVIGGGPGASQAQQAIMWAVLKVAGIPYISAPGPGSPQPGTTLRLAAPVRAAAQRFAALSPTVRHTWLVDHLVALRAGRVTLAQLP
jgi:hypothetical protein